LEGTPSRKARANSRGNGNTSNQKKGKTERGGFCMTDLRRIALWVTRGSGKTTPKGGPKGEGRPNAGSRNKKSSRPLIPVGTKDRLGLAKRIPKKNWRQEEKN